MKTCVRILCLLIMVGTLVASVARAADEDDEFFQQLDRGSAEKSRTRVYPGARDEQLLEMQTTLAQPTRSPDGAFALSPDSDDDPQVTAPASD